MRFGFLKWLNMFWVLPILSIVLVVFVFSQNVERGEQIEIYFKSALGLDTSKNIYVKYKNMVIGKVDSVDFGEYLDGISVKVTIYDSMTKYLNSNSRFWIVRPRFNGPKLTGIDSLLSGGYIAADLAILGKEQSSFNGLEEPPLVSEQMKGTRFKLVAEGGLSLQEGAPLYFNGVQVGVIEKRNLFHDRVEFDAFVEKKYTDYLNKESVFWNSGGVDVSFNQGKISFRTASFEALLMGGVSMGNPPRQSGLSWEGGGLSDAGYYVLHADRESAFESALLKGDAERNQYALIFNESINGVEVGTELKYLGIKVGEVKDTFLDVNNTIDGDHSVFAIVLVEIYLTRIKALKDVPFQDQEPLFLDSVREGGLSFRLSVDNFITGAKSIELFEDENLAGQEFKQYGNYVALPVSASKLDNLQSQLSTLLDQLSDASIAKVLRKIESLIKSMDNLVRQTNDKPQRFIFGD